MKSVKIVKKGKKSMRKAVIISTVLIALGSIASFVAAQPTPPPPEYYIPGFSIFGVLYLFAMFAVGLLIIYTLPHLRDFFKGGF